MTSPIEPKITVDTINALQLIQRLEHQLSALSYEVEYIKNIAHSFGKKMMMYQEELKYLKDKMK
jgi:hypothetical protein